MLCESLEQNKLLQKQNSDILDHTMEIKGMILCERNVPPQVLLQEPVILHDARGRVAPFHLELISSYEHLCVMLTLRFKNNGAEKVARGEYAITDTAMSEMIDLSKDWEDVIMVSCAFVGLLYYLLPTEILVARTACQYEHDIPCIWSIRNGLSVLRHNKWFRQKITKGCKVVRTSHHLIGPEESLTGTVHRCSSKCSLFYTQTNVRAIETRPRTSPSQKPVDNIENLTSIKSFRRVHIHNQKTELPGMYDIWICQDCGAANTDALAPENCPACGSYR